ncbi:MAG: response regulator [Magnetococcales bacterium]|nr:response regulator [Magnetococcales bacterium]
MDNHRRQTVLIVDDVPANIKIVMGILEEHYELMAANNGATAVKIARSRKPDLILLDVVMPGMNGYEVCQELKEDAKTREIPIIFLTAKDSAGEESFGFSLGAIDYITKPFKPSVVLARVRSHLEFERNRMELLERDANLQSILDYASDGIVSVDLQGRIVASNESARKLLGYSQAQLEGMAIEAVIVDPEMQTFWREAIARSLNSGSDAGGVDARAMQRRISCVGQCADGRIIDLELAMTIGQWKGEAQLTIFFRDVTSEKALLHSLENTLQAAESANKAKSSFLANVSHEIRSPMNAIIGMTDLMINAAVSPEECDNYHQIILNASLSLLQLVNDLLDLSKIEAGQYTIECIPFDLCGQVESACETLAFKAHQKGLELIGHVPLGLTETWMGDPLRVHQVLTNLINNAIKFTDQGSVVVEVEPVPVVVTDPTRLSLHFSVRDTGIGIPADKFGMIFEKFTQADESTTRKYGGTGLGLSLCRHLILLMGGEIWVESVVGHGSVFHFTLPFQAAPDLRTHRQACLEERRPSGAEPLTIAGVRVLLGIGHDVLGRVVGEILNGFGATVEWSRDLAGVQSRLETGTETEQAAPFDIIMLDEPLLWQDVAQPELLEARLRRYGRMLVMLPTTLSANKLERIPWLQHPVILKKPLRCYTLRKSILQVLGRLPMGKGPGEMPQGQRASGFVALQILLVEDLVPNQVLATAILQQAGHFVTIANNGQEALDLLMARKTRFDLVLMDLQMPVLNGFDTTMRIRQALPDQGIDCDLPIIAITANALQTEEQKCKNLRMDGFLRKPYRSYELLKAIEPFLKFRSDPVLSKEVVLQPVDVDLATLAEYRQEFLERGPGLMAELRRAWQNAHERQTVTTLLDLRAAAEMVGACRLATQALRLKGSAELGDWDEVRIKFDSLETLFQQTEQRVQEALSAT